MYSLTYFSLLVFAYLIGSINPSIMISKMVLGKDIRTLGSGNAGATNSFRHLGKKWGFIILFIDTLKGFVAVNILHFVPLQINKDEILLAELFLGVFAMLGHIFPLYSRFKGGKGVATMFGVMVGISPLLFLIALGGFLLVLIVTHFVSLGSILCAVFFSVALLVKMKMGNELSLMPAMLAVLFSLMVMLSHRKNIQSLLQGKERKIYFFNKSSQKEK